MRINSPTTRKAISPVLATVILIAITLIAAIAIAGFVFGLFGSFTSSAQISAQVSACYVSPGANATTNRCFLTLRNTGTSNAAFTGGSIKVGGINTACTFGGGPASGTSVPASGSLKIACTAGGTAQTAGSQAVGTISLSNGASVPFSGTWS